ncbi:MAG: multiprotein bridging factor aMBF1, partial [Candidatus Aenigmatarchaeota archaeon]
TKNTESNGDYSTSEVIFLECEVCGAPDVDKKADIDGAELVVCENCASLGENVEKIAQEESPDTSSETTTKRTDHQERKILKPDYGDLVQEAREKKDMTMEDLSEKLKEKESVIKRVENSELKPDESLLDKLERQLDIELTEEVDFEEWEKKSENEENLTIGDVAEIE